MSQTNTATQTFNDIENYIADAKEIIARGEIIELKSLEDRVRTMCESVAAMDKEEAITHKPELERLMQELDKLQSVLMDSKGKLQEELSGVQSHSVASHAYSKSGALAPKDD